MSEKCKNTARGYQEIISHIQMLLVKWFVKYRIIPVKNTLYIIAEFIFIEFPSIKTG